MRTVTRPAIDTGFVTIKLDLIDAGHFTWEEKPDVYADIVTGWWSEGYRAR
jgi:pimeloyl-ACP methyl ester carboxylesterase